MKIGRYYKTHYFDDGSLGVWEPGKLEMSKLVRGHYMKLMALQKEYLSIIPHEGEWLLDGTIQYSRENLHTPDFSCDVETLWSKPRKRSATKTYHVTLVSPEGEEYGPITDLKMFADRHNLNYSVIMRIITGKVYHYKGWRLKSTPPREAPATNGKTYNVTLVSPNGKIYKDITGCSAFADEHDLDATSLNKLLRGLQKQHKGWRLLKD